MGLRSVSDALVIDLEADLIPHPNGDKWVRLVVPHRVALELFRDLKLKFPNS